MNDLESRLEELFMADSRARRVGRVFVASRGSTFLGNAAFVGALALAALAAIVALGPLRLSQEQAAAPTVSPMTSAGPTATAPPQSAPPSAAPLRENEYANSFYGYTVTLPEPYHLSSKFTVSQFVDASGTPSAHPAAQDVFTVLTREQEDAGTVNCHTGCPTWNYTVFVLIYTDGDGLTARQAYEAGPVGYAGKSAMPNLEDVTIDGHTALKIEPGSSGNLVQYIVPDGSGRIFVLSAVVYLPSQAQLPPGASEEKVRAILDSFRLTSAASTSAGCSAAVVGTLRACPEAARVDQTLTLNGAGCNNPGAPAIIYFGTTDQFGEPTQGTYGAAELGRYEVDANGRFTATVTIPASLEPIQGQGGGPVKPGSYAIYSKPDLCRTYITVR